ncbi:myosin-6-like [Dreissena polymorpha]|uniref:myosin-6-like n=1 Tax=Dreissena polymorpha TaxID=45954 RepID=UPI0022652444|nr:myosin-6-like [Dreissena polymorpha]
MEKDSKDVKAGDKRTRDNVSSVSDNSMCEQVSVRQKKKKQKNVNKVKSDDDDTDIEIATELKSINEKLKNVITKDSKELKDLVKEIVIQLKEELFSTFIQRLDKMEGELFDNDIENNKKTKQIDDLRGELQEQKEENERLKKALKNNEYANQLHINELEQYSRRNNIRIEGIEDSEREDYIETTEKVINTLNAHIPDLNLSKIDIDISHRIGPFQRQKKRPIIVKMVSRMRRHQIMQAAKLLRKKAQPVYVNDHLTKLNAEVFASVRRKQSDIVKSTWTREGAIFYRDVNEQTHKVNTEQYRFWLDLPWPN